MTAAGPDEEWTRQADGRLFRRAARLVVVDEGARVLLVQGHDVGSSDSRWWFTVGGGIGPGESPRDAALRELLEETGLVLTADRLEGPVMTRTAQFPFLGEPCRQEEAFFLARLSTTEAAADLSRIGWTRVETEFVDDVRWWTLPALRDLAEPVYPAGLADLVEPLLLGWDGTLVELGLQEDE